MEKEAKTIDWISEDLIETQASAKDWKDAAKKSVNILIKNGYVTEKYIEKSIEAVETYGMYILITPGVALFHARPDESVLKTGLSLLTIKDGVDFGVEDKDPIYLAFSLAAKDNDNHLDMMRNLVNLLRNDEAVSSLKDAESPKEVLKIMEELLGGKN